MADVTISNLTNTAPNLGSIIPISQGGSTCSTALQQLTALPFIPKALGSFNMIAGGQPTNLKGFNVRSVVQSGNGTYTVTFDAPMPSANYSIIITSSYSASYNMVATIGDAATVIPVTDTYNANYFKFYTYRRTDGGIENALYNSFVVYHA
jgi:hypothetical protein